MRLDYSAKCERAEETRDDALIAGRIICTIDLARRETHELQRVLERQVQKLAGGVLGQPQCSALDRSAEADVRLRLHGAERIGLMPEGRAFRVLARPLSA